MITSPFGTMVSEALTRNLPDTQIPESSFSESDTLGGVQLFYFFLDLKGTLMQTEVKETPAIGDYLWQEKLLWEIKTTKNSNYVGLLIVLCGYIYIYI